MKQFISTMDFTVTKYSCQGSFTVKKGTIDIFLFLLKTIGSVNDPFSFASPIILWVKESTSYHTFRPWLKKIDRVIYKAL